ncbi:hypothetical protein SeMB42_g02908 [Synchytrium endobioticum]|uniref:Uncharacterized protein n=1 Tax=Synchytrium endobioticum TaxID=286115 RepID=A0A507DBI0_9FUNG|nr:hypothetical protein SeMB42_g02908 [Synchytrium endobioticum]
MLVISTTSQQSTLRTAGVLSGDCGSGSVCRQVVDEWGTAVVVGSKYGRRLTLLSSITMVKVVNINLVILLAAIIISIETAPVWDDLAIMRETKIMIQGGRSVVKCRRSLD